MKKYVAGMGLLLAALMFFGCKQPTEPKLNKLSEHETLKVSKTELDGAYHFKSGFTVDGNHRVDVYAARISGEAVSTLFSSAYYVGVADQDTNSAMASGDVKKAVGDGYAVGDTFNVGYRLVKTSNGEIERSKVVAVTVEPADKFYVTVTSAELKYALKKWYVIAKVNGKKPTLKAALNLGGNDKAAEVAAAKKGIVDGGVTVFTWEVPADKIVTGVPMHASFTFTDVEYGNVQAKSDNFLTVANGTNILDPNKPVNDDFLFEVKVLQDGNEVTAKLLEVSTADNPAIVVASKPKVKIANLVKYITAADTSLTLDDVTYYYAFSTEQDKTKVPATAWMKGNLANKTDASFTTDPTVALDYNKLYYLHLKGKYTISSSGTSKTVGEADFEKQATIPTPVFKTTDGLNEGGLVYDMKSEKTQISKAKYLLPGHAVENTPAALKTTADMAGSALDFDNNKTITSDTSSGMWYQKGNLSFTMRLPGESDIKTLLNNGNGKMFKLVNKDGKSIAGFGTAGTVELFTFTAGNVTVALKYYAPTYKSDKDDESATTLAKWTLNDQGKVNVVVTANGKDTIVGTAVLATSGNKLTSDTALDSVAASAVAGAVQEILFDANAWVAYQDCEITFAKEKITAKVGAASQEIALDKAKHIDISEDGYQNFTLTSKLDDLRVKNVKYMVTK